MRSFILASMVMVVFGTNGYAAENEGASNTELVTSFYNMVFIDHRTVEAADQFLQVDYIQHNPKVATGRQAFVDFFVPFFEQNPTAKSEIKRVIAQDDLVMLHVHSKLNPSDRGRAIVDIFRVKDGRIVEHWDVIQTIPETSANNNGMF